MEVATDNKNRTVSEIRHAFSKNGGNMGEQGSVAWMFERKGQIIIDGEKVNEDTLMNLVLEAGADDLRQDGDHWEVLTAPDALNSRSGSACRRPTSRFVEAKLAMIPKNTIQVEGKTVGSLAEDARRPRRARRRAERLLQLRHRREGDGSARIRAPSNTGLVRVLGIDCGTERTGYGVIDSDGVTHRMIDAGVVKTDPKDLLAERLLTISTALRSIIVQYSPDCVAVEEVFHAVNARSALKLAHVRGVALLLVAESRLPVGEYSPMEVKMSVVGYGRAEKARCR